MSLGYMIYTVSLQSKSLEQVDRKLDQIIRKQQQLDLDIRRLNSKL
jgi:formiminotetrahydrofolate cyclodeaminase